MSAEAAGVEWKLRAERSCCVEVWMLVTSLPVLATPGRRDGRTFQWPPEVSPLTTQTYISFSPGFVIPVI